MMPLYIYNIPYLIQTSQVIQKQRTNLMAVHLHLIHQANENSPYGDLTREEFYKKNNLTHHQKFMLNKKNVKIFTQSWSPASYPTHRLRGFVAMIHGYTSESSWLFELTAAAIAKAGFFVFALDLPGHGYSDGSPGQIPSIRSVVRDCIDAFDSARAAHPNLPTFLYGESLGGAIALLICLKHASKWSGLILNGAMCGVSAKFKPIWPLEKLLPVAAFVAPTWRIVFAKSPGRKSYKEEWKRKLAGKSPNRVASGKPAAATALEFLRVCDYVKRKCHELEVPLLMVHGGDDKVCDPESAKFVFESAGSKDKELRVFEGMWHMWIGESNESVELVFRTILSWIRDRADKAKNNHKLLHIEN